MRAVRTKKKRLEIIQKIIMTHKIESQIELLQFLNESGIEVTQATLSRDLKQLKVAKMPDYSGRYIYSIAHNEPKEGIAPIDCARKREPVMAVGGFKSIDFSGNIAVIKTTPGCAGSIAYAIDSDIVPEIVGTVAGDDTIFIVLKEGVSHEVAYQILSRYIPTSSIY